MSYTYNTITFITTVLLLVGVLFVVGFISYLSNRISCFKKYSDYQPEYTLFGGCRIELNGKMTPVEAVRSTDL